MNIEKLREFEQTADDRASATCFDSFGKAIPDMNWHDQFLLEFSNLIEQASVLDAANNDLFSLARPLVKFLCDNHHPHTKIIITCNTVELLEGIRGADISEFLRD
jgi:hypothetical protein